MFTKKELKELDREYMQESNGEFSDCKDCIHKFKKSPCPCDSCEQEEPTNFIEE